MKIMTKLVQGVLRVFSALPLGFHYAWAGFFAWLLRDVMHYRRDVVMVNLARSFPRKKYGELKEISDRFYRHLGEIIAETIWFGGCRNPERLHKKHLVEFTNPEAVEEAFHASPGVIVLNSHFGNWELTGGCVAFDYRPEEERSPYDVNDVIVVYKPLSSALWDDVMRVNRCAPVLRDGYEGYVCSANVLRYALSHRGSRKLYIFPTDQCPYRISTSNDVVDFMHQPTRTMLGGASIAHKFGYSVFYMSLDSVSRGHYEWSFKEICRDASAMSPHEIMQEYYNLLQADLERNPANYLWSHKRWK